MNVLKAYHDAADDQPRQAIQLELFRERLPAKPYHTDDLRTWSPARRSSVWYGLAGRRSRNSSSWIACRG
ncbi:hypothetical protein [Pseudomonas sp. FSL R10-0765]|uniref:hypothetical protein n=1 Tax=Pseudomonas sp. FSL R10-0765 TaxID=2662195 RepID=UPI001296F997|nr:hypothetical protein [Pseudomonas sp. FSL R10-0765]